MAAMIPAIRAAPMTSPFLASPARMAASVDAAMRTRPSAIATRLGRCLVRHVDHPRFAVGVNMGEGFGSSADEAISWGAPFAQAFA